MKAHLIAHTMQPETIVAAAAKLCYAKVDATQIMEDMDGPAVERFLDHLVSLGHESPIEHASFTFAIEGVSRTLTHQLVRHRLASYSQQSQRYVKLDQFEYVVPPAIAEDAQARALFIDAMEQDQKTYDALVEILQAKAYDQFISEGMAEKKARRAAEKKAIEDARYVFPNATETKIVVTMNARSLKNFFAHRCCQRAQWEIRELATEMLRQVREAAPVLFRNAGPSCLTGPCPEGAMTCGKMLEVRETFEKL